MSDEVPASFVVMHRIGDLTGGLLAAVLAARWPGALIDWKGDITPPGVVLIQREPNGPRLCVFSGPPERHIVAALLEAGPCSLLGGDATPEDVEQALASLDGGPSVVSSGIVATLIADPATPGQATLTPRQHEVVKLLSLGLSNREIATRLVVSTHTVRSHMQSISGRLGVTSRMGIANEARNLELV